MQQVIEMKEQISNKVYETMEQWEFANMLTLAELVIKSALMRTESRGAHYRTDYPETDDINFKKNTVV